MNEKTLLTTFQPVTGSEDFPNLFIGIEETKHAYKFLGIVAPETWAKAKEEGKEVPWANHNPNYLVDLEAIPLGGKLANIMVMDLMAK